MTYKIEDVETTNNTYTIHIDKNEFIPQESLYIMNEVPSMLIDDLGCPNFFKLDAKQAQKEAITLADLGNQYIQEQWIDSVEPELQYEIIESAESQYGPVGQRSVKIVFEHDYHQMNEDFFMNSWYELHEEQEEDQEEY